MAAITARVNHLSHVHLRPPAPTPPWGRKPKLERQQGRLHHSRVPELFGIIDSSKISQKLCGAGGRGPGSEDVKMFLLLAQVFLSPPWFSFRLAVVKLSRRALWRENLSFFDGSLENVPPPRGHGGTRRRPAE